MSFKYAFNGICKAIITGRNLRVQMIIALYILIFAPVVLKSVAEWAIMFVCICIVTALECLNSAIERCCDYICKDIHHDIEFVKDVSAGAILIASIFSACAGVALFCLNGRFFVLINFCLSHIWYLCVLIALTLLGAVFISGIGLKRNGDKNG